MSTFHRSAAPSKTYALFLPSQYRPEKKWPILYAFDARRHGKLAADLFREVAERRGWIVAASNNTESDVPIGPSLEAIKALLDDTHARLSLDEHRVYATGFSGGARMASGLASVLKGSVAGVIGCSGGLPQQFRPAKEMPFVFFGTAGNKDFNYQEMRALDSTLDSLGVPHRLAIFNGRHAWPPPEVCSRAVEWMELQAMKRGLLESDPILIEGFLSRGLGEARKAERDARFAEALIEYAALAADLQGLRDVAALERNAERLRTSASAEKELRAERKSDADEAAYLVRMGRTLEALRNQEQPVSLHRILEELEIPELKSRVSLRGDSYEGLSAERRLESVFVQTGFYLSGEFFQNKSYSRAGLSLLIAKEVKPEEPMIWYNLACVDARTSEPKAALAALEKAVSLGFKDVNQLETDEDLATLRDQPLFRQLLLRLRTEAGTSPPPGP